MTNHFAVWIDDLLGAVKENPSTKTIHLIESCGKSCASRRNVPGIMAQLREDASQCKTRTEILVFLSERLPLTFDETADGFITHLGNDKCNCTMAPEISNNADALCSCTLGFQRAMWSEFFGRPVEAEIVETVLRGGNECVFKIIV